MMIPSDRSFLFWSILANSLSPCICKPILRPSSFGGLTDGGTEVDMGAAWFRAGFVQKTGSVITYVELGPKAGRYAASVPPCERER